MTADPIESIRHAITHAHRRHSDKATGLYQPLKSDLEVGVDFLIAAARYRVHGQIDDNCTIHLLHLRMDTEIAFADLGLLHVKR